MSGPKMATGGRPGPRRYRIRFNGIGRYRQVPDVQTVGNRRVPDLQVEADDGPHLSEYLADQVYDYAAEFLTSRHYQVTVDLLAGGRRGVGRIDGGRFGFGSFTIEQVD